MYTGGQDTTNWKVVNMSTNVNENPNYFNELLHFDPLGHAEEVTGEEDNR